MHSICALRPGPTPTRVQPPGSSKPQAASSSAGPSTNTRTQYQRNTHPYPYALPDVTVQSVLPVPDLLSQPLSNRDVDRERRLKLTTEKFERADESSGNENRRIENSICGPVQEVQISTSDETERGIQNQREAGAGQWRYARAGLTSSTTNQSGL